MEALISLIPAALAFIAGIRMGPARSQIALRIVLFVAIALAMLARYVGTIPDHDWQTVALIAIGAGIALTCAVTFIGPSIFKRWLYALALSVAVLTLIRFAVPRDTMIWLLTGMSPP